MTGMFARVARLGSRSPVVGAAAALSLLIALDAANAQAARSFLWTVTAGQGRIYLAGSVHLLSKDYYPLSPALEAAYTDADLLVEEADFADMQSPEAQLKLLTRGMLPPGQSVDRVLRESTYALVARRVAALGMPIEPLRRFKPWMLALTLVGYEWQKAGFDAELGLDQHFFDRATADGKMVQGLETVEYQIARLDGMTMEHQDRLLAESLEDLDAERASLLELIDAWKTGDAATVERIVRADANDDPVLYQRLLVERNRNWLARIEPLFARTGRALVVVGAAHLVGPDGLLAMLRARGYTVDQQ